MVVITVIFLYNISCLQSRSKLGEMPKVCLMADNTDKPFLQKQLWWQVTVNVIHMHSGKRISVTIFGGRVVINTLNKKDFETESYIFFITKKRLKFNCCLS